MTWRFHTESLTRLGLLGYRLYATRENLDGSYDVVQGPLVLQHYERGAFLGEDAAFIDDSKTGSWKDVRDFLQAASDAAWELGIKPRHLEDSRNELKALREHLADMRILAGVNK